MYVTPEEMHEDLERRRRQREHVLGYYEAKASRAIEELRQAQEALRKALDMQRVYSE